MDNEDTEPKYSWPNNGRPPMFKDPEDMQSAIVDYFRRGVTKRQIIVGRADDKKVIEIPVPTITGLVLFLGFADRHSFYDYEKKPEFSHTIKRARTFIEREYEEILNTSGNAGAIFALKNFGWVDRSELQLSGKYEDTREKIKDFLNDRDDLPNNSTNTASEESAEVPPTSEAISG